MKHLDDLIGTLAAKELTLFFFVICDSVPFYHADKSIWCETGESGFTEMGIAGEVIMGIYVQVREITTSPP
jgi:hypothetical protein